MDPQNLVTALDTQLASSLDMLTKAVENANEHVWTDGVPPFWQHAFHITNSMDFYLSTFEFDDPNTEYSLPDGLKKHVGKGFFDKKPEEIVPKSELLEFLKIIREKFRLYFENDIASQFEEPCNFTWLSFSKFELIIYNIRHIMEHTAILNQRLKANGLEPAKWVGKSRL